ncbi:AAA family ATPase [Streptomyces sp. NPDC086835]|uniref:AAA family ATPase n=1 Tax=Streptomyces sp. NPDC086835 TaxID=3365761 RepID=UPI0038234A02
MTTSFLGRSKELERISRRAVEAASGVGNVVVVEGEAGIGKTALLRVAAGEAHARGMRVLMARAREPEHDRPLGAARRILAGRGDRAAGAPAAEDFTPVSRDEARHRIVDLCAKGPVALVLDDAHWADTDSLRFLQALAGSVSRLPLLLVLAYRDTGSDHEAGHLLQILCHEADVLPMSPLAEDVVRDMAAERLGLVPGTSVLRAAADAAGNPLFITKLLNALIRENSVTLRDGKAELATEALPRSLDEELMRCVSWLPASLLQLLRLAAAIDPTAVATGELAAVSGRPQHEVAALVHRASALKILTDGSRPAFRHPLLARACYRSLPPALRPALHLDIAVALAETAAHPQRVAHHLALAPPTAHPKVITWLMDHSPSLMQQSPRMAAKVLQSTLGCIRSNDPGQEPLRLYLAQAQLRSAVLVPAREQAREALASICNSPLEGAFRWVLAYAWHLTGRPEIALREAEAATHCGQVCPEEIVRFKALASVAMLSIDLERAERMACETIDTAQRLRVHTPADAWYALAAVRYERWQTADALKLVQGALLTASTQEDAADVVLRLHVLKAYCLLQHGEITQAERAIEDGRRMVGQFCVTELPLSELAGALTLFAQGRWEEALTLTESGLSKDCPDDIWTSAALRSLAAVIHVRRGALTVAKSHLARITPRSHISPCYAFLTLWSRCLVDVADGAPERAVNRFLAETRSPFGGPVRLLAPRLVCLANSFGHTRLAQELADDLAATATKFPSAEVLAIATHCRGLLTNDVAMMAEASHFYAQLPWLPFRASYHEDMAAVLARAGRLEEARRTLYRALDIYDAMGASWDAVRATSRLRELGVRNGYRGRRGRPSNGWQSLTETELTVAELVAQGLSNPEVAARLFVSRRTIQTHVSSIFSKLGLTSRVELAAFVIRRGTALRSAPPGAWARDDTAPGLLLGEGKALGPTPEILPPRDYVPDPTVPAQRLNGQTRQT